MNREAYRRYLEDNYRTADGGALTAWVVSDYVSRAARAERLLGVDLDNADLAHVLENIPALPVTRGVAGNLRTAVTRYADFRAWRGEV